MLLVLGVIADHPPAADEATKGNGKSLVEIVLHSLSATPGRRFGIRYPYDANFAVSHMLVPDSLKDELQAFRDPNDHAVRKELEKATDSNSEPQRKAAIKRLVDATHRTRSAVQLRRTLKFLRMKLKNEQITMRANGIGCLMSSEKTVCNRSTSLTPASTCLAKTTWMRELLFISPQRQIKKFWILIWV